MRPNGFRFVSVVLAMFGGFALVASCGGSSGDNGFGSSGGGGSGGGGSGSGGFGGSGSGGTSGSGSGGQLGGGDASTGPTSLDGACAATSSKGQQAPLDIYMMLDQSQSMSEMVAGGMTKWAAVTSALNTFVMTPQTGVSVGLQYFGLPPGSSSSSDGGACTNAAKCKTAADCGGGTCLPLINICICGGGGPGTDSCNGADYAKADVEIAPLPGVASAISTSIAMHAPSTATPTSAALQGATQHASDWAKAHPGDVVIALLATDGDPTECDTNIANIGMIASAAAAATPKILTFVIGVGTSSGNLNAIAMAGGTGQAFIVDTTMNVNQQFLNALNMIRGTALGCSYTIPVPKSGTPDYNQVNVQYTSGPGAAPVIIPKVSDQSKCPSSGNAWYYDNNSAPTMIVLCDATCKSVLGTAGAGGEVDVLLGCTTIAQ
jgi:hypothetical protein